MFFFFFLNSHHSLSYVAKMVVDNQCNPCDNSLTETVPLSTLNDVRREKQGGSVGKETKGTEEERKLTTRV